MNFDDFSFDNKMFAAYIQIKLDGLKESVQERNDDEEKEDFQILESPLNFIQKL